MRHCHHAQRCTRAYRVQVGPLIAMVVGVRIMFAILAKSLSRTLPVFVFAIALAGQPLVNIGDLPRRDQAGMRAPESQSADSAQPSGYVLGPEDQIAVWAPDCGDISGKPINI